jgi:hypothetical protein
LCGKLKKSESIFILQHVHVHLTAGAGAGAGVLGYVA